MHEHMTQSMHMLNKKSSTINFDISNTYIHHLSRRQLHVRIHQIKHLS